MDPDIYYIFQITSTFHICNQYSALEVLQICTECLLVFFLSVLLILYSCWILEVSYSHSVPYPCCCYNDPISPQQSIKFHLSYWVMKRFSVILVSHSEGHKFSKGKCNISSITSGWKDKCDAPLSTHNFMICEGSIIPPFRRLVQKSLWITGLSNCFYWCTVFRCGVLKELT